MAWPSQFGLWCPCRPVVDMTCDPTMAEMDRIAHALYCARRRVSTCHLVAVRPAINGNQDMFVIYMTLS